MVVHLVEALRCKLEGCGFDSPMGLLGFFIELILVTALCSWGRLGSQQK